MHFSPFSFLHSFRACKLLVALLFTIILLWGGPSQSSSSSSSIVVHASAFVPTAAIHMKRRTATAKRTRTLLESALSEISADTDTLMSRGKTNLRKSGLLDRKLSLLKGLSSAHHDLDTSANDDGFSYSPLKMTSPERVSWTMARTAGRKHREVFYSQGVLRADEAWGGGRHQTENSSLPASPSASSSSKYEEVRPADGVASFPLDYLRNHLINSKASVLHVLWQFSAIVKPYVEAQRLFGGGIPSPLSPPSVASSLEVNKKPNANSVEVNSHSRGVSMTSLLSCLHFTTKGQDGMYADAALNANSNDECPSAPEHFGKDSPLPQAPESTQTVFMWELVKEAAALGYRTCVGEGGGASSPSSSLSSSSPSPASSCAVGRASELLFWALRGEDYAVGRGRAVQSSVLLDALQEEVGGEEAPYWVGVPAAVSVGGGGVDGGGGGVYRYAPSRRRPHPQFVAYRGVSYEGFDVMTDEINDNRPSIPVGEALRLRKNRFNIRHPVNPKEAPLAVPVFMYFAPGYSDLLVKLFVDNTIVWAEEATERIFASQPNANPKRLANRVIPFSVRQWMRANVVEPSHHSFPKANDRATGITVLERYYEGSWGAMAQLSERALLLTKKKPSSGDADPSPPISSPSSHGGALPSLLPQQQQQPFCAPILMTSPRCFASRTFSDHKGRDPFHGYITGPENRARQTPMRLEDAWDLFEIVNTVNIPAATDAAAAAAEGGEGALVLSDSLNPTDTAFIKCAFKEEAAPASPTQQQQQQQQQQTKNKIKKCKDLRNHPITFIPALREARRSYLSATPPLFQKKMEGKSGDAFRRRVLVTGDYPIYRPYLDPRSPQYRRILCATYSYHKNNERVVNYHQTGAHLCDKHLIFTDKPMPDNLLSHLDQGRFVVVALNTPGGEDYHNMWQKTRMILEKLEFIVYGYAGRTEAEGANDPQNPTRAYGDEGEVGFETQSVGPKQQKGVAQLIGQPLLSRNASADIDVDAIAKQLLPYYSGFDHVLLSGDDVCMNMIKLRRYMAAADALFGALVPNGAQLRAMPLPPSRRRRGRGRGRGGNGRPFNASSSYDLLCSSHSSGSSALNDTTKKKASRPISSHFGFHRVTTTPNHIGYGHRDFVSGANYLMNIHAYHNYMISSYATCAHDTRVFAEDFMMGMCHRNSGVRYRNAADFGTGEDAFNTVDYEAITGQTHTVGYSWWLKEYRRKTWPRGGAILSRDCVASHFCAVKEMRRSLGDAFGWLPDPIQLSPATNS